jgi:iron complex outermembrane receptor protein
VDDYYLIHARVGYHLTDYGEIYMAVENVTGKEYEYLPGYPMAGTNWMLGTRVSF